MKSPVVIGVLPGDTLAEVYARCLILFATAFIGAVGFLFNDVRVIVLPGQTLDDVTINVLSSYRNR